MSKRRIYYDGQWPHNLDIMNKKLQLHLYNQLIVTTGLNNKVLFPLEEGIF